MNSQPQFAWLLVAWTGLVGAIGPASALAGSEEDFFEMSLSELLSLEVTSVAKKPQRISEAAAAVFIITQEDIRRSGVTNIPEALRMAPGVHVAHIDANKWAVSIRDFNRRFANKLLVLMDGRTLYTPSFSGVYWDVQDTVLEDIERIEVIRGPGATLWGANAVNGVINIITKSAAETQGGLWVAGFGSEERGFGTLRYGAPLGDLGHYRVYAKLFERDGSRDRASGDHIDDDWGMRRIGFRTDTTLGEQDALTVQGDYYTGQSGETVVINSPVAPYQTLSEEDEPVSGANLLLRWNRVMSPDTELSLQGYYDRTERDWTFTDENRDTLDLDFQFRTTRFNNQDLLFGLGYRYSQDNTHGSFRLSLDPDSRSDSLYSAFVQNDITLVPKRWVLIMGSKFEHNDYTGFEIQPNVRLLWTPDKSRTFWASIARAVRTPSRAERDARIIAAFIPPNTAQNPAPLPLAVTVLGDKHLNAEKLLAYEMGYRFQPLDTLGLDFAVFYNDYASLQSSQLGTTVCQPGGVPPACFFSSPPARNLLLPVALGNDADGKTYGLEVVADWQVLPPWRIRATYAYLHADFHSPRGTTAAQDAGLSPDHQFSLRSSIDLPHAVDLDLWLRYTDGVKGLAGFTPVSIDDYVQLDARLAWLPHKDLELSIVGQNLLQDRHPEYVSELGDIPVTEVERSVYAQVRWSF